MTRIHKPDETIAESNVDELKTHAKYCEFNAVTAEQHKDCMARDALIRGLTSASIRQRLLEKVILDLSTAVNKSENVRTTVAKRQSGIYDIGNKYNFLPVFVRKRATKTFIFIRKTIER